MAKGNTKKSTTKRQQKGGMFFKIDGVNHLAFPGEEFHTATKILAQRQGVGLRAMATELVRDRDFTNRVKVDVLRHAIMARTVEEVKRLEAEIMRLLGENRNLRAQADTIPANPPFEVEQARSLKNPMYITELACAAMAGGFVAIGLTLFA